MKRYSLIPGSDEKNGKALHREKKREEKSEPPQPIRIVKGRNLNVGPGLRGAALAIARRGRSEFA